MPEWLESREPGRIKSPVGDEGGEMYGYQTRRGEDAPNAKLTVSDRQEIRQRRERGDTYAEIAADLGVSINTVRKVAQGISYQDDW
jgi:DNA-directed RNA polymerase specialized sigma24 family protein